MFCAEEQAERRAAFRQNGSQGTSQPGAATGKAASAGKLDFTKKATTTIKSVLDLVGVRTSAKFEGAKENTTLDSPFSDDRSAMSDYLPKLLDNCTVYSGTAIFGRINIKNNRFITDFGPVDAECECWCCRNYSAAYLRHLYKCDEILASRLATYHNLYFYQKLVTNIRVAIEQGRLGEFRREFLAKYRKHKAAVHDEVSRQEIENAKRNGHVGHRPAGSED